MCHVFSQILTSTASPSLRSPETEFQTGNGFEDAAILPGAAGNVTTAVGLALALREKGHCHNLT